MGVIDFRRHFRLINENANPQRELFIEDCGSILPELVGWNIVLPLDNRGAFIEDVTKFMTRAGNDPAAEAFIQKVGHMPRSFFLGIVKKTLGRLVYDNYPTVKEFKEAFGVVEPAPEEPDLYEIERMNFELNSVSSEAPEVITDMALEESKTLAEEELGAFVSIAEEDEKEVSKDIEPEVDIFSQMFKSEESNLTNIDQHFDLTPENNSEDPLVNLFGISESGSILEEVLGQGFLDATATAVEGSSENPAAQSTPVIYDFEEEVGVEEKPAEKEVPVLIDPKEDIEYRKGEPTVVRIGRTTPETRPVVEPEVRRDPEPSPVMASAMPTARTQEQEMFSENLRTLENIRSHTETTVTQILDLNKQLQTASLMATGKMETNDFPTLDNESFHKFMERLSNTNPAHVKKLTLYTLRMAWRMGDVRMVSKICNEMLELDLEWRS